MSITSKSGDLTLPKFLGQIMGKHGMGFFFTSKNVDI